MSATNTPTVEPSPAVTTPSTQGRRHHRSRHHGSTRQTRPRFVQIENIALSVIKGNIIHQTVCRTIQPQVYTSSLNIITF